MLDRERSTATPRKRKGLYIMDPASFDLIYGPEEQADIARHAELIAPLHSREAVAKDPSILATAEVIFSGWGAPLLDDEFLDAAPNLRAFFHGAGTVGYCITKAVWERGVLVTTANAANAIPVAEYTVASILFSLKHAWHLSHRTRQTKQFPDRNGAPGAYGRTVGLVSLGTIGRAVLHLLGNFDLKVLIFDPFLGAAEATRLGVECVSLEELFRRSDVVSIHTPLFPETRGLVTGALLQSMRSGASIINTSRGPVIRENEMLKVLLARPDLQAVLDVTETEPPEPDSPLYTLPNVFLTPHIAGSVGNECRRMGRYMVDEFMRYLAGKPLLWEITPEVAARSTHRPVRGGLSVTIPKKRQSKRAVSGPLHGAID